MRQEVNNLQLGKDAVIAVGGLSHGAAAALLAAVEAGEGLFTHVLQINPFYGISGFKDALFHDCQQNTNPRSCAKDQIKNLIMQYGMDSLTASAVDAQLMDIYDIFMEKFKLEGLNPSLPRFWAEFLQAIRNFASSLIEGDFPWSGLFSGWLDSSYGWGDFCKATMLKGNRNGLCSFKIKHLLAAHSFGQYALSQSRALSYKLVNQMISVERDGVTRDSMIWESSRAISVSGSKVYGCMYSMRKDCVDQDNNNTCGVPHSMMDPADNLMAPPYNMYWEDYTLQQITAYVTGHSQHIGSPSSPSSISECSEVDPLALGSAVVLHGGILRLSSAPFPSESELAASIASSNDDFAVQYRVTRLPGSPSSYHVSLPSYAKVQLSEYHTEYLPQQQ
jgi:hypothetical protein